MDKYELTIKIDKLDKLVKNKDYVNAAKVAEQLEWKKMKQWSVMSNAIEAFVATKKYEKARNVCIYAYNRKLGGRRLLATLMEMYVELDELDDAQEIYQEYIELAPTDVTGFILLYKLKRAQGAPVEELITILQNYKEKELDEEYEFELALLYSKAGLTEKCVRECDELVLWFSEGVYVEKALKLKQLYAPLTPRQEAKLAALEKMSAMSVDYSDMEDKPQKPKKGMAYMQAAATLEEPKRRYEAVDDEQDYDDMESDDDEDYNSLESDDGQDYNDLEAEYESNPDDLEDKDEQPEYESDDEEDEVEEEESVTDDGGADKNKKAQKPVYIDDIGNTTQWTPIDVGMTDSHKEQPAVKPQPEQDYDINIKVPDYSVYDTRNVQQELKANINEIMEAYHNREKKEALRDAAQIEDVQEDSDPTKEIIINKHQWRKASRNMSGAVAAGGNVKPVRHTSQVSDRLVALAGARSSESIREATQQMTLEQMSELVAQLQAEQERRKKEAQAKKASASNQMDISQWISDIDADTADSTTAKEGVMSRTTKELPVKEVRHEVQKKKESFPVKEELKEYSNEKVKEKAKEESREELPKKADEESKDKLTVIESDDAMNKSFLEIEEAVNRNVLETTGTDIEAGNHANKDGVANPDDTSVDVDLEQAEREALERTVREIAASFERFQNTSDKNPQHNAAKSDEKYAKIEADDYEQDEEEFEEIPDVDDDGVNTDDAGTWDDEADDYEISDSEEYDGADDYEVSDSEEYDGAEDYEVSDSEEYDGADDYEVSDSEEYDEADDYEVSDSEEYDGADDYEVSDSEEYDEADNYEISDSGEYDEADDYEKLPDLEKAVNDGIEQIIDDNVKISSGRKPESGRYVLTDEEKVFLDKYLYMSGMEKRLCRYIGSKRAKKAGKADDAGNIAIMGSRNTDKIAFAVNLFKALHVYDTDREQKLARISASRINEKGYEYYADKLVGQALVVENAGRLKRESLVSMMKFRQDTLFIIIDEEFEINKLFAENPDFAEKFTGCFLLKQYTVNELVDIAKDYAENNSWRVEDKALLKLYLILSQIPNDDQGNVVELVKNIMDHAAKHAGSRLGNKLFGRFRAVLVIKESDLSPDDEDEDEEYEDEMLPDENEADESEDKPKKEKKSRGWRKKSKSYQDDDGKDSGNADDDDYADEQDDEYGDDDYDDDYDE